MCRRWKYIFEADFNSRKIGPIKSVHTNPPGVVDNSKRFKNKWLSRSNRAFSMSVEDAGLKSFEYRGAVGTGKLKYLIPNHIGLSFGVWTGDWKLESEWRFTGLWIQKIAFSKEHNWCRLICGYQVFDYEYFGFTRSKT